MSTDREKQTGANTAGQSELIEPLDTADALIFMAALRLNTKKDIDVFYDRGWGSAPLQISIIVDGNGQKPLAFLTETAYRELLESGVIAPNCLHTYKARKCHPYIGIDPKLSINTANKSP